MPLRERQFRDVERLRRTVRAERILDAVLAVAAAVAFVVAWKQPDVPFANAAVAGLLGGLVFRLATGALGRRSDAVLLGMVDELIEDDPELLMASSRAKRSPQERLSEDFEDLQARRGMAEDT